MKLAIMQPYFLPYLGYFQLINAVDQFIVYDNIEYTKKGWINRNRILINGKDSLFTIPLQKASDSLQIKQRTVVEQPSKEINKCLGQIKSSYAKAPYFKQVYPLLVDIFLHKERNLFAYIFHSIQRINQYLGIQTPLTISSTLNIEHSLKGKNKVIALCSAVGASIYINPIGGTDLYDRNEFSQNRIDLQFHKMNEIVYPQGPHEFIKSLSIIDVMMFNSEDRLKQLLGEFILI